MKFQFSGRMHFRYSFQWVRKHNTLPYINNMFQTAKYNTSNYGYKIKFEITENGSPTSYTSYSKKIVKLELAESSWNFHYINWHQEMNTSFIKKKLYQNQIILKY